MRARLRSVPVVLGLLGLVAAGCGDGAPEDAAPEAVTAPDGVRLDDGAAAVVGDSTIPRADLDERVELLLANPQINEQVAAAPSAEAAERQLAASTLSQMITTRIVLEAAEDEGITVSDEEVAEVRAELAEQAGGEEQLTAQLQGAGLPEGQFERELRGVVAFEKLTAELTDGTAPATATEMPPELQDWLARQFAEAEVTVAADLGTWDPTSGQVVPTAV